jgi:hypothetical protein
MQSLQSQQAALSQTERISQIKSTVEEAFSESKENQRVEENRPHPASGEKPVVPFQMHEEAREKALAALLMRARDDRENKGEDFEPKNAEKEEGEEEEDEEEEDSAKDDSMETSDIPQMTIKPVEVLPSPPAVSKPMEMNIPSAANEISAQ